MDVLGCGGNGFFKSDLMQPAIAKIVLVPDFRPCALKNIRKNKLGFIMHKARGVVGRRCTVALFSAEIPVQVTVIPPHHALHDVVEIPQVDTIKHF
jgi:hypothetical protein